jgi:methylamine dehydrogenase accessory protein MauD
MTGLWYAAFGLLAVLVSFNSLLLVSTMRQVGVLHERVRPMAAGDAGGPRPGNSLPWLPLEPVVTNRAPEPKPRRNTAPLAMFAYVTPGCRVCDDVLPMIHAFARTRDPEELDVVMVTDASRDAAEKMLTAKKITLPLLRYDDLSAHWDLPGSPYVFVARRQDTGDLVALAGGVVNTMEQLESVFDTAGDNLVALSSQGVGPDPAGVASVRVTNGGSGRSALTDA